MREYLEYLTGKVSELEAIITSARGVLKAVVFNGSDEIQVGNNSETNINITLTDDEYATTTLDGVNFDNVVSIINSFYVKFDNLSTSSISQENNNKILLKYKANDFALWVNGFESDIDTSLSSTPIGLDRLNFDFGSGSLDFYGKTKQLRYYDEVLTDIELEELTSWDSFRAMAEGQNYEIE